jgi:cytochrome bd-type quinol oxidase subunit 2
MMKYDLLVYLALLAFLIVIAIAAWVLMGTPDTPDLDTRKIRFAAVTFTGILMLFVFTAILYFVEPQGPGKEIFDKAVTAMTPLAGVIIGYLFGSRTGGGAGAE